MNDSDDFSIEKCEALAQANVQNVQLIFNFAEKHKDSIISIFPKPDSRERDICIKGLWSRAYFWLCSLNRLNETKDFQAFGSANRALLEISIDLSLLHQDKTNVSGWKMRQWSLSEKLQGAEQIVKFYTDQNITVPDTYSEQQEFIQFNKSHILAMRNRFWNGNHPQRWTGNRYLSQDVKNADTFLGKTFSEVLGKTLLEYFQTEYKKMNWYVHSGVASFWNLPKEFFPTLSACFLKGCADFAFISTQIVLKDFGLSEHLPDYKQGIENLELKKMDSYLRYMESEMLSDFTNPFDE